MGRVGSQPAWSETRLSSVRRDLRGCKGFGQFHSANARMKGAMPSVARGRCFMGRWGWSADPQTRRPADLRTCGPADHARGALRIWRFVTRVVQFWPLPPRLDVPARGPSPHTEHPPWGTGVLLGPWHVFSANFGAPGSELRTSARWLLFSSCKWSERCFRPAASPPHRARLQTSPTLAPRSNTRPDRPRFWRESSLHLTMCTSPDGFS